MSIQPNFLVVGWGSAGRRQALLLRRLFANAHIKVLPNRVLLGAPFGPLEQKLFMPYVSFLTEMEEAEVNSYEAIFVCNPAAHHLTALYRFDQTSNRIFVEKPFSSNYQDALKYIQWNPRFVCDGQIGYHQGFLESLIYVRDLVKSRLKQTAVARVFARCYSDVRFWRSTSDFNESVSISSSMGGGVLNELSHEIDYLIWFFGAPTLIKSSIRSSPDFPDIESSAQILFEFEGLEHRNRVEAHVELDFCSPSSVRTLEVQVGDTTIFLDLLSCIGYRSDTSSGRRVPFQFRETIASTYERQLAGFLGLEDRWAGLGSVQDALSIVKTIHLIKSAESGSVDSRSLGSSG
jgi:predicted dehydrogenase